MAYDYKTVYEKQSAFYQKRPKLKRALVLFNGVATVTFMLVYAALIALTFIYFRGARGYIKTFALPIACLATVTLLRRLIHKPRPYQTSGANITPLLEKTDGENESFPSRHLASAFVIATLFCAYFPWTGIPLYLCGIALGYTRFALGLHYPSDLLFGAGLGLIFGIPAFFI